MPDRDSAHYRLPRLLHGADYNYEQWLEYPEVLDEDFRLMREAGIDVVSVGIFSWAMLEPREGAYEFGWLDRLMERLAQNDISAILATPSGARPAWLSASYPEVRQVNAAGQREPHRLRHNHCRTSPVYREKTSAMNSRLAQRYGSHPALLMWHVSNEYGAGGCYCPLCLAAFRDWLRQRYGDLDTLNRAWWTRFWSHSFSAWEQIEPVDESVHGLMLDWQRFTSHQTLDFFLTECAPLRDLTPNVPITTNFMQPDVGLDYWKFAQHVDIVSWDSYPRWHMADDVATAARTAFYHDLHRSYKGRPFMLMESTPSVTNWQGISRPKRPGMHVLSSLQAVAHGSNTVQYFQWRQGRGGSEKFHGAVVTNTAGANTRTFREVSEVSLRLRRLGSELTGTNVVAEVGVVYDFQNEWALRGAQLPQNEVKAYQDRCAAHHAALWRLGVSTDVIDSEHALDGYRLVVAPMLYMLRTGVAERLAAFVRNGGILVTTYLSGLVDESDLSFLGGFPLPLRQTLGLWVEETDAFHPHQSQRLLPVAGAPLTLSREYSAGDYADVIHLEGAEAIATYGEEYYAGSAALTVNRHGEGEAYYLASRPADSLLAEFYRKLIERHQLTRIVGDLPAGVSVVQRTSEGRSFTFVMNFTAQEQTIAEMRLEGAGRRRVLARGLALGPYAVEVLVDSTSQ